MRYAGSLFGETLAASSVLAHTNPRSKKLQKEVQIGEAGIGVYQECLPLALPGRAFCFITRVETTIRIISSSIHPVSIFCLWAWVSISCWACAAWEPPASFFGEPSRQHSSPKRKDQVKTVKVFLVAKDGSASLLPEDPVEKQFWEKTYWPEISGKLEEPHPHVPEIRRLIIQERGLNLEKMVRLEKLAKLHGSGPDLEAMHDDLARQQLALDALEKSVHRLPWPPKGDVLNTDGPKVQYFRRATMEVIETALRNALGKNSEPMVQEIMKRFKEDWAANQSRIRSELEKMGESL